MNKNRKVLILHNILWAHYKSVLFQEIEKALPENVDFLVAHLAKSEISRKNMEYSSSDYCYNYTVLFDDYIENISTLNKTKALLKLIFSYKPDIINISGWGLGLPFQIAFFVSKLLGIKIILSSESSYQDNKKSSIKELYKTVIVKLSNAYISFGKSSKDYLLKLGAKEKDMIESHAAVVDDLAIEKIYTQEQVNPTLQLNNLASKNFVFVGRLIPIKNVEMLIAAFQKLKATNIAFQDWGLLIIGSGQDYEKVSNLINQNPQHIKLMSGLGWKDIPKYMTLTDCLILPSHSEPWGLVVNEAMLCNQAVIVSTKCGCLEDLVNGNGFSFDPENQTALEQAMIQVASASYEALNLLKSNSQKIIANFKVKSVAKRIANGILKV